MKEKGFSEENFRFYHPGGSIGKKLLKVKHLMHAGKEIPVVKEDIFLREVIHTIDKKRFGVAIVIDDNQEIKGIITDGDLRRYFLRGIDFNQTRAKQSMTKNPLTIGEDHLAVEALKIMEEHLITSLIVRDKNNKIKGLLHLHDLWRTEMI